MCTIGEGWFECLNWGNHVVFMVLVFAIWKCLNDIYDDSRLEIGANVCFNTTINQWFFASKWLAIGWKFSQGL